MKTISTTFDPFTCRMRNHLKLWLKWSVKNLNQIYLTALTCKLTNHMTAISSKPSKNLKHPYMYVNVYVADAKQKKT